MTELDLDFAPALASLVEAGNADQAPRDGDIWRTFPAGSLTGLYWKDDATARETRVGLGVLAEHPGVDRADTGQPRRGFDGRAGEVETALWLKLYVRYESSLGRIVALDAAPRTGLILCGPSTADRVAAVPGFAPDTEKDPPLRFGGLHPELVVDCAQVPSVKAPWIRHEFWRVHGVSTRRASGTLPELLHRVATLRDCSLLATSPPHASASPDLLGVAKERLASVLGLRERPDWCAPEEVEARRSRSRYRRGELVRVTFGPGEKEQPCLVVSDEVLNSEAPYPLVVLQTLPYSRRHEERPLDALLVPLHSSMFDRKRALDPIGERRTVAVALLRGIANAGRVKPYKPPIRMRPEVYQDEIVPKLEDCYGA